MENYWFPGAMEGNRLGEIETLLDVGVHICTLSNWKAEAGGSLLVLTNLGYTVRPVSKNITETNKQKNPEINPCSLLSLFGKRLITARIRPLNAYCSCIIYYLNKQSPTFESLKEGNLRFLNFTYSKICLGFYDMKMHL